jgi:hypothetical protein
MLSACAGSLKQRISAAHITAQTSLKALDKAEEVACAPDPNATNHCTSGNVKNLDHQTFSGKLKQAYDLDAQISVAIQKWNQADALPVQLGLLLSSSSQILTDLGALTGAPALTAAAAKFQADMLKLITQFGK